MRKVKVAKKWNLLNVMYDTCSRGERTHIHARAQAEWVWNTVYMFPFLKKNHRHVVGRREKQTNEKKFHRVHRLIETDDFGSRWNTWDCVGANSEIWTEITPNGHPICLTASILFPKLTRKSLLQKRVCVSVRAWYSAYHKSKCYE